MYYIVDKHGRYLTPNGHWTPDRNVAGPVPWQAVKRALVPPRPARGYCGDCPIPAAQCGHCETSAIDHEYTALALFAGYDSGVMVVKA